MNHDVNKSDIIWGYLSQFLNIAMNIILLPFIFIYLNTEDIGVWYVFITIISLVQMLECGFLPTISRYISYVYSGVSDILNDSVIKEKNNIVHTDLLSGIIFSSKKIYLYISIVAGVFIGVGGTFYISTLDYTSDIEYIYYSWWIYGGASIVLFYFGYYNSILKGRGDQTNLNKVIVVSKLTNIAFVIPMLMMGFGIMSISIGMLASALIDRFLIRRVVFSKKENKTIEAFKLKNNKSYIVVIWNKAKLIGLVQLGNFLATRCSLLIVSSYIGLETAAAYGFTIQITSIAVTISTMYFALQIPRLSAEYVKGNINIIKKIIEKSLAISWVLFFVYSVSLVTIGPVLLSFISENITLIPRSILIIFLLASFLEMNHSLCTGYLTTKNEIKFTIPIFITGLLITISSYVFGGMYGFIGVVLSQFILQLLYNNWKWPLIVFKELNLSCRHVFLSLKFKIN